MLNVSVLSFIENLSFERADGADVFYVVFELLVVFSSLNESVDDDSKYQLDDDVLNY